MNRNLKSELDHNYRTQQQAIKEICNELNLVAYYPNYHADKTDKNTVIIYTKEGHEYNETLPDNAHVEDEKGRICEFENSDINGHFNTAFMNFGRLDFRGLTDTKEILKNYISAALIRYNNNNSGF